VDWRTKRVEKYVILVRFSYSEDCLREDRNLERMGLTGVIPETIGQLSKLNSLYVL
jgi:hypothetical protein